MYQLGEVLSIVDHSLNTKRKRHITGGVLLSISLLFGGLAFTIISMKMEDSDDDIGIE
jgi:hypothetical protein